METPRFESQVEQTLRCSGWLPNRTVLETQLEKWAVIEWPFDPGRFQTRIFSAAYKALREFGGLIISQNEQGVSDYRHTLTFDPLAVPKCGYWTYNWTYHEWAAKSVFFPLGYAGNFQWPIAIDMQGRVLDPENEMLIGNTIEEAIHNLIVGIKKESLEYDLETFREGAEVWPMIVKRIEES